MHIYGKKHVEGNVIINTCFLIEGCLTVHLPHGIQ